MKQDVDLCLRRGLETYEKKQMAVFSMPGHKGNFAPLAQSLRLARDVTEVPSTDSLFHCADTLCGDGGCDGASDGIIYNTERKISTVYNSAYSLLSAGGATACIQTMIMMIARRGSKIILNRNCHVSAVNTCAFVGLAPVWAVPAAVDAMGVSGPVEPAEIERLLQADEKKEIGGVLLTSPDYFGIISDLGRISEICRKHHVLFACDNAHGAHLKLVQGENRLHPLDCGVDLCCDSAHKTLPALTGAAYLHASRSFARANPAVTPLQMKQDMALFCSTSPSYLIMQSVDICMDYLLSGEAKSAYTVACNWVKTLETVAKDAGFALLPQHLLHDPARLCLGFAADWAHHFTALLAAAGVEPEYCSDNWAVFLPSCCSRAQDFKRLLSCIEQFGEKSGRIAQVVPVSQSQILPRQAVLLREAVFSPFETVKADVCEGRVAASTYSFCPPGITPVIPGEQICKNTINILKKYGVFKIKVIK